MRNEDGPKNNKKAKLTIAGGILALAVLVILTVIGSVNRTKPAVKEMTEKEPETAVITEEPNKAEKEETETADPDEGEKIQGPEHEDKKQYDRVKKAKGGLSYTPYASASKWESLSNEEKAALVQDAVPVLQDKNKTIDRICARKGRPDLEPYSYLLASCLKSYCGREGIAATEGEFLAYGQWISQDEESFYVVLNDKKETIVLVTAEMRGMDWHFEQVPGTREEVLKQAEKNEDKVDDLPAKTAKDKTKTE